MYVLDSFAGCVRAQHVPNTAPLNVCIYKVTDRAGDCWSLFEGCPEACLYQVQIAHNARPSLLMNFRDSFLDFLKQMSSAGQEGYPDTLESLRDEGGIRLVLTDKVDPENIGFAASSA